MRALYASRSPVIPAEYVGDHVSALMDKLNNIDLDIDPSVIIPDRLPIFPEEEPSYTEEDCPTGVFVTYNESSTAM